MGSRGIVYTSKLSVHQDDASTSTSNVTDTQASTSTPIQTRFFSGKIPPTPGNVDQVAEIEELVSLFRHQTLDSPKLTLLHKTLKAARLAMADRVVLNRTNTDLLAANTRKKQRTRRTGLQYDGKSARVLSLDDVEERRQLAENKKKDKEVKIRAKKQKQDDRSFLQASKDLMRLGPELIYGPDSFSSSKSPDSSARNKKRGSPTSTNALQDLLRIAPDLFEELVIDDLVSDIPVRNKEKGVSRKKNTSRPIQGGVGLVEEEKEEEVVEVRISSRGRIIRNTRKM